MVTRTQWDSASVFGRDQPTDPDQWVYHYTTVERAAAIALLGGFMLSPLDRLNDPRESKSRQVVTLTSSDLDGDPPRVVTREERMSAEKALAARRSRVRVSCFTRDSDLGDPGSAKRSDARGFARPAMWAHYAAQHRGVCLAFDRATLIRHATKNFGDRVRLVEVNYMPGFDDALADAEMVNFDRLDLDNHFLHTILPSLATKNTDWENEREWRIIIFDDDDTCVLPVENSVVGLVLGIDFREDMLPIAEALCSRFGLGDESVGAISMSNAVLDVHPARGPDGNIAKWDEDASRAGAMFDPQ